MKMEVTLITYYTSVITTSNTEVVGFSIIDFVNKKVFRALTCCLHDCWTVSRLLLIVRVLIVCLTVCLIIMIGKHKPVVKLMYESFCGQMRMIL